MAEQISTKKQKEKKVPKAKDEKEMSFWDHLSELRGTFIRSLFAIVIFSIVAFLNKDFVFNELILSPKSPDFFTNRILCALGQKVNIDYFCVQDLALQIININMSGQFMTHMYISFMVGLVVSVPYIIYEFWKFIAPALHENERKGSSIFILICSLLFIIGILFAYYLIVPITLNFFGSYQVSETIKNQISLDSYISTIITVTLSIGIVFELPILIYFLAKIGLVSIETLKKNRKYTLVIVLIIAAIVTPPDVFSQILVTIPLMILYEVSIWMAKYAKKRDERMG
ncbi:MAG TPA: twin-arginine translocase subunit TatC [Bacteroidales bacterium]|nr:twin-arginine translocase subunit TatC [Bacteroidales bacterium]